MSNKTINVALFSGLTLVCLAIVAAATVSVAVPVVASGESPTGAGIASILLPLFGAGGGLMGAIVTFLHKSKPAIDQAIDLASGGNKAVRLVIDTGEIGVIAYLHDAAPVDQKPGIANVGRVAFDALRDKTFPLTPKV